jgi:hypothetical protein
MAKVLQTPRIAILWRIDLVSGITITYHGTIRETHLRSKACFVIRRVHDRFPSGFQPRHACEVQEVQQLERFLRTQSRLRDQRTLRLELSTRRLQSLFRCGLHLWMFA